MCEQIGLAFLFSLKKGVRTMSNIKHKKKITLITCKNAGPNV